MCSAKEKHALTLDASSHETPVKVAPNSTTYVRLEAPHVGDVRFLLQEVSIEVGSAESERVAPAKTEDLIHRRFERRRS